MEEPAPDPDSDSVRIDRWLWAVRLLKSRKDAADACRRARVQVDGKPAKPSRPLRLGSEVVVETGEVRRRLRVVGLLEKRVPAKEVASYYADETPPEELERARHAREEAKLNAVASERPSKRDRRQMEAFLKAIK
ncbi:RNA-binding S4 domain-containing protein [soil metagenome]